MAVVVAVAVEARHRIEAVQIDRQCREEQQRQDQRQSERAGAGGNGGAEDRGDGQKHRQQRPVHQQHRLRLGKQRIEQRGAVIAERPDGREEIEARHLSHADALDRIEIDRRIPGVGAERQAQLQAQRRDGRHREGGDPQAGRAGDAQKAVAEARRRRWCAEISDGHADSEPLQRAACRRNLTRMTAAPSETVGNRRQRQSFRPNWFPVWVNRARSRQSAWAAQSHGPADRRLRW